MQAFKNYKLLQTARYKLSNSVEDAMDILHS